MSRRRPLTIELAQSGVRWLCRVTLMLVFRIRVHGLRNYPPDDGFLICANHQSYLDPIVIGVICPRPINYLGRKSLFRFKPLAWFLDWNDTIPIDREGSGIGGLKETMRRLKRRETVLMFPEGTRSPDGELQSVKLGFCAVARRAKSSLVPIAFDGAFQAMPRTRLIPFPGRIHAVIGKPILFRDYQELSDEELGGLLEQRTADCFAEAGQRWKQNGIMD